MSGVVNLLILVGLIFRIGALFWWLFYCVFGKLDPSQVESIGSIGVFDALDGDSV